MNILFLYWGKKGGGAKYSLEVARGLSKLEGVHVHLSVSDQCEIIHEFNDLSLPTLHVATYRSVYGFIKKYTFQRFHLQQKLENYILINNIQCVIIGMDFFWSSLIYNACKKTGSKAVYVVHEPKPHPREPVMMSLVKRYTIKKAITGAHHVVTLTGHVKNYIEDRYGLKNHSVSVIPHGIFSYYKAHCPKTIKPESSPVILLYFGRIEYYKGLDILLNAYLLLEKEGLNVRLEIWGSGDMTKYGYLVDVAHNIRIENRWIDEDEIPGIFKRADICLLPYRDASQSGVVGIASEAALPIVACPAQGLKEQLEKTGAVFSQNFSTDTLFSTIKRLIDNPKIYAELSGKSLRYANSLSWSTIALEFMRVCKRLQ